MRCMRTPWLVENRAGGFRGAGLRHGPSCAIEDEDEQRTQLMKAFAAHANVVHAVSKRHNEEPRNSTHILRGCLAVRDHSGITPTAIQ